MFIENKAALNVDTKNSFHWKIGSITLHPGAILFSLQKFGLPDPSLLKGIMKDGEKYSFWCFFSSAPNA